jgi:hypothetical protein
MPQAMSMLKARAIYEGRGDEWAAAYQKAKDDGNAPNVGNLAAQKMMGYVSREAEYELHLRRIGEAAAGQEVKDHALRVVDEAFDEAVASLPANSSFDAEQAWVYAHPAMRRITRQTDAKKQVVITVEDLTPQHGPAPSQAAVNKLVTWVNSPKEFFKENDKKHKVGVDTTHTAVELDIGLAEAKRLLMMMHQNKADAEAVAK